MLLMEWITTRSLQGWIPHDRSSASGGKGFLKRGSPASMRHRAMGVQPSFPPSVVVAVKALACELPHEHRLPLSRLHLGDIRREAIDRGLVASVGGTTLWRWLAEDAIRPWCHRTWIFPRDPAFQEKAGRLLDLYAGEWEGVPLTATDCVISTDEKTSIQARARIHDPSRPAPGRSMRVEHEYQRMGAWAYLVAWDIRRAKVFGMCEKKTGIASFMRLVEQVMNQEPYRSARRVFWVMDNGSSHRGAPCAERLGKRWPTIIPVHTPVHASWLNQVEVYFSIVERKALTPNDFKSLAELEDRLMRFQEYYERAARPFEWKFNRADLARLMSRLEEVTHARPAAA